MKSLRYLSALLGLLVLCAFPAQAQLGKIAFNSDRDNGFDFFKADIYTMNEDGSGVTRLTNNTDYDAQPFFSPDGSKIAFESSRDSASQFLTDIYVMDADGQNTVRLTTTANAVEYNPVFSPDGSKIAFTSNRDGNMEIYIMDANGANQTRLTNNAADDLFPSFSPNGSTLVFHSGRNRADSNFSIWSMSVTGTNVVQLTTGTQSDKVPSFSPSGAFIVFISDRDGNNEIYVMNANGTGQTQLTNNAGFDTAPSFNFDGSKIVFDSDRVTLGASQVYLMNADGTNQTRLTNTAGTDSNASWAPPPPKSPVTVTSVSANEGNSGTTTMTFNATIPAARTFPVFFGLQTANGLAQSGSDYVTKSGSVTIPTGATSATFTVSVLGDTIIEANETFFVALTGSSTTTVVTSQVTGTILNDDTLGSKGGKIVFDSERDGNREIYAMNGNGSNPTRLTNNAATDYFPIVSPDGSKIVFASDRDGDQELYIMNADGSSQARLTFSVGSDVPWSFSPDGSKIAFSSSRDPSIEIYTINTNGTGTTRLTNNGALESDSMPTFSPDGSRIAFLSDRGGSSDLWVMNASGSSPTRLTTTNSGDSPGNYRPDGAKIVISRFVGNRDIYLLDANGANPTQLTTNAAQDTVPRFSPDSSKIAFTSNRDGQSEIYVMSAAGANQTPLTVLSESARPFWAPNIAPTANSASFNVDRNVALTALLPVSDDVRGTLTYTVVSPPTRGTVSINSSGQFTYTPNTNYIGPDSFTYRVTDDQGAVSSTATISLVVASREGKIAFASERDGNFEIYAMNANGSNQTRLTNNPAHDFQPVISLDGTKIAFASTRDGGDFDVFVMNADGSNPTRVTNDAANDLVPQWSADGTKLIFHSDRGGGYDIFSINLNGTGETALTNTNSASEFLGAYSPNGSKITYRFANGTIDDVYVMDANGANPTRLTTTPGVDQPTSFSPDSSKIGFYSLVDGKFEIYVMDTSGANPTRLTNNSADDGAPAFRPDGAKIVFDSNRDGNAEIYVMSANGSAQTRLTNNAATDYQASWGPNIAPTAGNATYDVPRNTAITEPLPVTDDVGGPLTYAVVSQPLHGTVSINAAGQFTYTPTINYAGPDSFTYRATDNQGAVSALATISLLVAPSQGKIAFASERDGNFEIYVMNANGSNQTRLTNNPAHDFQPVISLDGTKIAFASTRDGGDFDVFVMNADGSNPTRVTNDAANDLVPQWSADGTKLIFHSDRGGGYDIFSINLNGTGETALTNTNSASEFLGAYSPNGSKITYRFANGTIDDVYVMDANGANPVRLTTTPGVDQPTSFSPDSSKIGFYSLVDGKFEIYVMDANGANSLRLTNNSADDGAPAFRPDGAKIVFDSNRDGNAEIYVMKPDGSAQTRLTNNAATDYQASWGPNIAPTATSASFDLPRNTSLTRPLSATDDVGGPLTYTVASQPLHGTVSINASGQFTYTPTANYVGPDSFTFRATDNQGAASAPATISLRVTATPSLIVNTTSDTGTIYDSLTSLRDAITFANTDGVNSAITFDATVFAAPRKTIVLTSGLPVLIGDGTISITGPTAGVAISGNGLYRVFFSDRAADLTLRGLTITRGFTTQSGAGCATFGKTLIENCTFSDNNAGVDGGALWFNANGSTVTMTVRSCTLTGNTATGLGGGILNYFGRMVVENCTFSNNTATQGGAVLSDTVVNAPLTMRNCTITGNTASVFGGGIYNYAGPAVVENCTITGNTAPAGWGSGILNTTDATTLTTVSNSIIAGNTNSDADLFNNVRNTFQSSGYNLIGNGSGSSAFVQTGDATGLTIAQLKLGTLANNGGATETVALLTGSPAINAGNSPLTTDQRGIARPQGAADDIGAFELDSLPSLAVNNPRSLPEGNPGASGSVTFDITLSGATAQTVTVNYQTINGINNPATAGVDYTAKSGKLTFTPGQTLKRVTVSFIGDSTVELNETFFFDLKTPTNATIFDNRGVGQINNDDGPGISIANAATVDEGNSGNKPQTFAVTLSAASTDTVTVDWATANGTAVATDYVAASGTLTFAPGETSKIITIQVKGDTIVEPNETYKVILSKVTYAFIADGQGVGTIRNDDAAPLLFENDEPSR